MNWTKIIYTSLGFSAPDAQQQTNQQGGNNND